MLCIVTYSLCVTDCIMFEMSFDCKWRFFKCTDLHIWIPFRTTTKWPLVNVFNFHYSFLQLSSSACSTRGKRSSASSAITCGCTWGRSSGTTTKAQPSTSTTLTASPCTWRPGWCSWTVLSAWSCGRYAAGLSIILALHPLQSLLHAVHVSWYMQQGEERTRAKE